MSIIDGKQLASEEAVMDVAKLCTLAALKAPRMAKTKISTVVVTGDELKPVQDLLEIIGEGSAFTKGDAMTLKAAIDAGTPPVAVLIGANASVSDLNWNCGACGFATCADFNAYTQKNLGPGRFFAGPSCHWKLMDHGMALSTAAAAAAQYNLDNRLQASVGAVSALLGYITGCTVSCSLTLGPPGLDVYYNRKITKDTYSEKDVTDMLMRNIPTIFQGFQGDAWPQMKLSPTWFEDSHYPVVTKVPEVDAAAADIGARLQKYLADFHAKNAG